MRPAAGWAALATLTAAAAAPVVVVLWSVLTPSIDVWRHLWETRLPAMLWETTLLVALVVGGALVLGTGLAWLVSAYTFPGRRLLGWLLVTPLAVPGYVLGFVWLDTLQDPLGARAARSLWLAAAVLILTFYPYVYLFARAAFREQSRLAVDVARSLGCTPWRAWWRVTLPLARPSLAAGAALVAMEVLTDVGTVRLFNVSTVADGVLRVWFGLADRHAATQLAVLLVGAAVAIIVVERSLRGRARFTQVGGRARAPEPIRLSGAKGLAALALGGGVLMFAVGLPVARLVLWAEEAVRTGQDVTVAGGLWFHVTASLWVVGLTTFVCLAAGVLLAVMVKSRGRRAQVFARLATIGYAVPGPVVAVGAVVTLAALYRSGLVPPGTFVVGSLAGLVYALSVRFMAVGYHGIEASVTKVGPNVSAAARTLGAGLWRTALRVDLPLARAGLAAAAALVATDTLKDLPITLLLRPFGFDTLSVWVWQATSEALWVQAAVPSLAMVVVGMVPLVVLLVALERGAEVVS